ncbi:E3 ubiquitin-protein ligase PUB23-like [Primulina huaijiensis]|uniref:E3 ubiquitin-protein ligase PUB23-like n=1 Tax=Primulina huaijiensis TaxID=1492673 RepID=UPI003CC6EE13
MEEAQEIEIPCYFVCPISMQLMKDPVTVSTGITYDRESIEKWLFQCKNSTCPVTKQDLSSTDLTPNHTLRRLMQEWCTFNAYERIPTPKAPVEKSQILKLLQEAKASPKSQINCLHRLRSIAHRDESSRNHLQQAAGAVEFLVIVASKNEDAMHRSEALSILHQIQLSESDSKKLLSDNGGFLESLMQVMDSGDCQSRAHAVMLLKSAFYVADPEHLIRSKPEIYKQIVHILRDKISQQATKTALKLLVELCPWGRNRIKAVENGAVSALIELLLETEERRACELVLTVLDQLCGCAEGRAELLAHGAGLAIVSKKILRVSNVASERAVRIICSITKHSSNSRILNEMMQVGVVSKLCLVLQVESSHKTKERAKEILRLHSRVWKDSSCIPPHLLSSYPLP